MVKISPEWVTGPERGKSNGRIATFSLWTGMFRDGISSRDARRTTAAEMKYRRRTAEYIWTDYKKNIQISRDYVKITSILDNLLE